MQEQLWNAGPVRTQGKRGPKPRNGTPGPSHKRKYLVCREPGCDKPPRSKAGATYCEEHARAIDYKRNGLNPEMAFKRQATCLRCGRSYRRLRVEARSEVRNAWDSFCPICTDESPLTIERLRKHNVPAEFVTQWLMLGAQLACGICGRPLNRRTVSRTPHIDHDHACCKHQHSCGKCVRGVLCRDCNQSLGFLERSGDIQTVAARVVVYLG